MPNEKREPYGRYSIFEISGHRFAIEIERVREVLQLTTYSPVPNVNDHILGVFNLRGQIFTLLDFRPSLQLGKKENAKETDVLVLEYEDEPFGLSVDQALDVVSLDPTEIEVPTEDILTKFNHLINGVVNNDQYGVLYILDLERIMAADALNQFRI